MPRLSAINLYAISRAAHMLLASLQWSPQAASASRLAIEAASSRYPKALLAITQNLKAQRHEVIAKNGVA